MADDKVLEDEKVEQASGTDTAEPEPEVGQADEAVNGDEESAPETTAKESQPAASNDDDTYENVAIPMKSDELKDAAETKTDDNKIEPAAAETTEEPIDENVAAAQPLTTTDDDVECGQQNGEANKDKPEPPVYQRILRNLKKREILFPVIGGVTFLLGLILIITGLLVMQGKCDRQVSWAGNGKSHLTDPVVEANGDPDNSHVPYMHSHDNNETEEDDGNVNLAEGRRAFQSTTNYLGRTIYNASLAVDGNTTARFLKGECAQTEHQARASWHVDLGMEHTVKRIKIIIPSDCCVGELHDFKVRIGTNEDLGLNTVCKHFMGTALHPIIQMKCDQPIPGRYVSIHLLGDDARPRDRLTLCEVMVYSR